MFAVERAFVRVREGQVHLRRTAENGDTRVPIVLLHPSPGSSINLVPLMQAMAARGAPLLIAPDALGNGDSAAPTPDAPDIAYFAGAVLRTLDALGIERFHVYGALTGARIACEMALIAPDRITGLAFDGMGEFDPALQALLLERYAPEMRPHEYGYQLVWAFNFVRDQALHFPYFLRDPAHRLMSRAVPDADELHMRAVEVLKALRTYHKSYRAAFPYPTRERLTCLSRAAYFLAPAGDAGAITEQTRLAALVKNGGVIETGGTPAEKAVTLLRLWG